MTVTSIPLSYTPIDVEGLAAVLRTYEGKRHTQIVADFEKELERKSGAASVVALNSGTSALHMALLALKIGKGDVVIAPTFTYVATINPILYVGATPVFVDSESLTWNMDPDLLEETLNDLNKKSIRPKAIMVVHTYGMPAQMSRIIEIANRFEIPVIEDAAEAIGSTYQGKQAGTLGAIGVYSFNNNKIFTTYGGGAVLTNNENTALHIHHLASHARENVPYYEHHEKGYNYLMSPLNAAQGLSQLPYLQERIGRRREIFNFYRQNLSDASFQNEPDDHYSNRWLSCCITDHRKPGDLLQYLATKEIETRRLWKPMHLQPVFKDATVYGGATSESLFERGLCLPSGSSITSEQLELIVNYW